MVRVKACGFPLHALVDTGAGVSAISYEIFEKLQKRTILEVDPTQTPLIQLADGSLVKTLGCTHLPITVDHSDYWDKFCILPFLGQDIILGMPFLTDHAAVLDFNRNRLILPTEFPVKAPNKIIIPPKTEVMFMGTLGKIQVPNGVHGATEGYRPFVNTRGLLTAQLAVAVGNNEVPVRVLNHTNKPRTINIGERVGTFTPWREDTLLHPWEPLPDLHEQTPALAHIQPGQTKLNNPNDIQLPHWPAKTHMQHLYMFFHQARQQAHLDTYLTDRACP